jgi:hypothetical protein
MQFPSFIQKYIDRKAEQLVRDRHQDYVDDARQQVHEEVSYATKKKIEEDDRAAKKLKQVHGQDIVRAFTLGGVSYYKYEQAAQMPFMRAYAAINTYSEVEMRCTREYLQKHSDGNREDIAELKKAFTNVGGSLNLIETVRRLDTLEKRERNLQERLKMILVTETALNLAAIYYFDDSEDPTSFDQGYARKKIQRWKDGGLEGFFTTAPVRELIPFLDLTEEDLQNFIKVEKEILKEHSKGLLSYRSQNAQKTATS